MYKEDVPLPKGGSPMAWMPMGSRESTPLEMFRTYLDKILSILTDSWSQDNTEQGVGESSRDTFQAKICCESVTIRCVNELKS